MNRCLFKTLCYFLVFFLCLKYTPSVFAIKEIGFEVTDPTRAWEIGRDKTYDYSGSVLKEDNGETKIYTCGGGIPGDPYAGHDAIYLTIFNSNGVKTLDQKRVLSPLLSNQLSDDWSHACSPTIIKHSFAQLAGGAEKYLMYYECAPMVFRRSDGAKITPDPFTQTCVAFSDDGINWQKYNEDIWTSQYRFANENEPPTPVIKINPLMVAKYGIEKINGKYWTNLATFATDVYGVGHPSALVRGGEIWLYYYDSVDNWNSRGSFLVKSWDGIHFGAPIKINDNKSPADIKYINAPIGNHQGFFVNVLHGVYNYSWDGINWGWTEIDTADFFPVFLANNYSMGLPARQGICLAPGGWAIAGDKFGTVSTANVDVYINEGKRGIYEGCTATNGCTCYSSLEDQSRGYTWQTYRYKGKFVSVVTASPTPTRAPTSTPRPTVTSVPRVTNTPRPSSTPTVLRGDIANSKGYATPDGHVDSYDVNALVSNFGKTGSTGFILSDINRDGKVNIFDYSIVVGSYGK